MNKNAAKHVNTKSENLCSVCGSQQLKVFFEMSDVPVHCNVLWSSQVAARNCPTGDIKLAFCPVCSFITNLTFEPARLEYTQTYENSLFFSPRFQDYAKSLATRLIERYDLHNKEIIEIGCGKGDFLLLLCELGNNHGVGFDPSYVEREINSEAKNRVRFIQDFYSEHCRNYQGDLYVCRQTLEHIENPKVFLNMLRRKIGDRLNTYVFFEVPNVLHIFRELFVWDVIYEHCSYFTPFSLSLIFSLCGFRVCELTDEYEGQYFCLHAQPDNKYEKFDHEHRLKIKEVANETTSFAARYRSKVETCRRNLEQIEDKGQRIVVWGAGSKGVTFLNTLKNLQIEYVVDINPHKQGMYVPRTGQRIVAPEFLRDYQPDVIVVMNPLYRSEIQRLSKRLGITAKFVHA